MLAISELIRENPGLFYGKHHLLVVDRPLLPSDVASIRYTIYEQSDPYSSEGTPVPYFTDVNVPVDFVLRDEVKKITIHSKYGSEEKEYNSLLIISPLSRVDNGVEELIYAFPNIGKYYRIVITFEMKDPTTPNFPQVEIGQAV